MSRRAFSQALWPGLWLAGLLAVLAFALSFLALRAVGVASGVDPTLAWMFPVIIDGFIVLATWATWRFRAHGLRAAWYPAGALVVFSAVSLTGNALHAHPVAVGDLLLARWAAAAFSAVPPVALLAASHMLVMIATHRRRADATDSPVRADRVDESSTGSADVGVADVVDLLRPAPGAARVAAGHEPEVALLTAGGPETPTTSAERSDAPSEAPARPAAAAAATAPRVRSVAQVAPGTDDELEEWVRKRVAAGLPVTGPEAVADGVFTAESTARRRLRMLRESRPQAFTATPTEAEAQ